MLGGGRSGDVSSDNRQRRMFVTVGMWSWMTFSRARCEAVETRRRGTGWVDRDREEAAGIF